MNRVPGTKSLYISTTPLYLDSHIKKHDPELHSNIEWAKIQLIRKNRQQLIDEINESGADVVCVSLYIWNCVDILTQLKGIKSELKKPVTIVAGGPSAGIYNNRSWLDENPDVDYCVYTQGEVPFLDILQHLAGKKKISVLNTKNVAWKENNKLKLADFEFLRKSGSHYLESQHLLKQITSDPEYSHIDVFEVPYETSRGCTYACAFCDWTAGLTHKVSHRKSNWYEEFKLFGDCRILYIHMSDANVGQVAEDIAVWQAMVDVKQDHGHDFKIYNSNFSKNQKARAFEIIDILMEADILARPKFAVQDTNDEVMANIERPDIPWSQHKEYILATQKKYPDRNLHVELILGLPGQTRKSWAKTLQDTSPFFTIPYKFIILPDSPAGSKEYQDSMKMTVLKTNILAVDLPVGNFDDTSAYDTNLYDTVVETYSYNLNDYAYFMLLDHAVCPVGLFPLAEEKRIVIEAIDNCLSLESYLEKIKQLILSGNCEQIKFVIQEFLKEMYSNRDNNIPPEIAKKYLKYRIGVKNKAPKYILNRDE